MRCWLHLVSLANKAPGYSVLPHNWNFSKYFLRILNIQLCTPSLKLRPLLAINIPISLQIFVRSVYLLRLGLPRHEVHDCGTRIHPPLRVLNWKSYSQHEHSVHKAQQIQKIESYLHHYSIWDFGIFPLLNVTKAKTKNIMLTLFFFRKPRIAQPLEHDTHEIYLSAVLQTSTSSAGSTKLASESVAVATPDLDSS